MFAPRRFALNGAIATLVWYTCILTFWALQPLNDSVPVGVDYTRAAPASVSVSVDCNELFDSAPRDDSVPALKVQPAGKPPLAFQREPCVLVQDQARMVFIFDTLGLLAVVGGFVLLALRRRRPSSPSRIDANSTLVELRSG